MKRLLALTVLFAVNLLHIGAFAAPLDIARPETVGMSAERLDHLKHYLQGLLDDEKTGGFQVLVARGGKVVMYENLGYANVEEKIPVTDATLFRIYSMTKPVIAVAMMMLYEEGHYSLADPLSKHIPEFADLEVYVGEDDDGNMTLEPMDREPTIHDLLQHAAGFTYGIFGDTAVDKLYREMDLTIPDMTLEEFIGKLAHVPLLYQPGTRWNYSVAVDVQGYLVEKWSGMALADFLEERIFEPLGMDQTMAWVPPGEAALLAEVYTRNDAGEREPYSGDLHFDHFNPPRGFSGGAQLISTADDYWRFCQMLLNGGELDGKRLLSPLTVRLMSSNRLPDRIKFQEGYGFGFNVGVTIDHTFSAFPMSNGEYYWAGLASTIFWIDPEEDLIAVLMTQYLPYDGEFYRDVMHRLVRAAIIQ